MSPPSLPTTNGTAMSTNGSQTHPASHKTPNGGPRVLEYNDAQHAEDASQLIISAQGYKHRLVDGIAMPPYITPSRYHLSRTLHTKPTDVCFVSYPKSGSTWLSYILVLLTSPGTNLDSHSRGDTLRNSLHWVESSWTYPRSREDLDMAPDPRVFKSHMPYSMALGGDPAAQACRYVYIARNPKDVCVSYYRFESGKSWSGFFKPSWELWLDMFCRGEVQRGDWFEHVLGWWRASREQGGKGNILFLTFEDLKRDTAGQIRRIAEFLRVDVTQEKLDEVVRKIGFGEMQKTAFSGLKDVKEFNEFFRKGEIGSWKDQFTVRQAEEFDRLSVERMKGSGLDFIFE
ncbi:MAG: hypothetical protein LQ346_007408 [Caloplaca aetnensis]|nr:MAG: hypothetical protein LQ346_007408 [Caloplaca aetnensis]